MAIMSRKSITAILANEGLSPEEKVEQIFALHGQALDAGYVTKEAAAAAKASAVEEAQKSFKIPDPKESAEYKALNDQFAAYKTKQEARTAPDYASIKPKFFDAVYDRIDHTKPVKEQIEKLKTDYEEFFNAEQKEEPPKQPQFGTQSEGTMPKGDGGESFAKYWGFPKKG